MILQEAQALREELAAAKRAAAQQEQTLQHQLDTQQQQLDHVRVQKAALDTRLPAAALTNRMSCLVLAWTLV